jgi:3-methyladenine DNA glycosylase/8-oxoguanine DNA glycosylase
LDDGDPFKKSSDDQLLEDPHFHQQNTYAIAMRILARFEHALGRRLNWGFGGQQLKIAPHAFCAASPQNCPPATISAISNSRSRIAVVKSWSPPC